MKKLVLIIALGLGLGLASATPAFAYDNGQNVRFGYVSQSNRLGYRISEVDRQLDRVKWQLRRSGAHWQLRREVSSLSRQLDRVKWQYRHNASSPYRLARQLEGIRRELDRIQDRLHDRRGDQRGWDR